MTAFVLGNGISRKDIDPAELAKHGDVYGCNALYRTYSPTVLVATDQHIARQIQESGYSQNHRFYTRRPLKGLAALSVPKEYFGFSSGPTAVALAAKDQHDPIYLLGFDMGPDQQGNFNNLYVGTEFYKANGSTPTYTGNWVKQLIRIMGDAANQRFVRVYGATTAKISELDRAKNLKHLDMVQFLTSINTASKDSQ